MNKITIKEQADTLIRDGKIEAASYLDGEQIFIVEFGGQIYSITYGKKITIERIRSADNEKHTTSSL